MDEDDAANDRPHPIALPAARPRARSLVLLVLLWGVLQGSGLFRPGLLDDVDSVYLEIAREMLRRHDFVTPYIDGIRFFDKPPLMYWLAAASMRVFGEYDWAGRLPLALGVLALLLAVYALGLRLYRQTSPADAPDRGAFYSALALGTALGVYLYTRFYIPDLLIALWMTLGVHLFSIALDRAAQVQIEQVQAAQVPVEHFRSSLWPSLGFGAVLGLNLLTKGLIGLAFPLGFAAVYLLLTRQLRLLRRMHLAASAAVFAAVALPWHVLAALRNPAIAMPAGQGLPARTGWAWFYLYNEHIARFLGKRIPHDYGQTPVWLFWVYAALWIMPWTTFLPAGLLAAARGLGHRFPVSVREREAALTVTIWSLLVLGFFTLSSRQEYYSLPALPALAFIAGGLLGRAERVLPTPFAGPARYPIERQWALRAHGWFLLPLAALVALICGYFALAAPRPAPGADLSSLLSSNPELYNLSLGHLFDLTGAAMGLFRMPLALTAVGMLLLGPAAFLLRMRGRLYGANLTLAAGMSVVLLAAHEGLVRFNPILGSKALAEAIVAEQRRSPEPGDLILLDGELTGGSTLLFYTRQPVHLVNGRINGPWFGSFWPDAPQVFEDDTSLHIRWHGQTRLFLMTYSPVARLADLRPFGPVRILASAGGKTILTNR